MLFSKVKCLQWSVVCNGKASMSIELQKQEYADQRSWCWLAKNVAPTKKRNAKLPSCWLMRAQGVHVCRMCLMIVLTGPTDWTQMAKRHCTNQHAPLHWWKSCWLPRTSTSTSSTNLMTHRWAGTRIVATPKFAVCSFKPKQTSISSIHLAARRLVVPYRAAQWVWCLSCW